MNKKEIRQIHKQKRAALSQTEIERLHDLMLMQFQSMRLNIPKIIMTYAPFGKMNEFDPQRIVDHCAFKNPEVDVCYPVMNPSENGLFAVKVHVDTAFVENDFGIEEPVDGTVRAPKDIDMIFLPLLAFDMKGNRVGYGKGYYDRFLSLCKKDVVKVGFSFFEPVEAIEDINDFDIPLDFCVTPQMFYSF